MCVAEKLPIGFTIIIMNYFSVSIYIYIYYGYDFDRFSSYNFFGGNVLIDQILYEVLVDLAN